MFNVQFNVGRTREVLRQAIAALDNPEPMYRDIGEYMTEATRKRFVQGMSPQGTPWAPKSPATLERYRQRGYGSLTRPLIGPSKRLSREIVQFVSRDGVVIGSSLQYAEVMQSGAAKGAFGRDRHGRPIPWGRIPARQWLGISKADEVAIIEIADEHVGGPLQAE